jgi:carbon-monoxide dehydrogenase medium subunit
MINEYLRPDTVSEAFDMLLHLGPAGRLVGGGTDLAIHPPAEVTTLIDLSRVGLDGISEDGDSIVIGGTATLSDILEYRPFERLWSGVLHTMLQHVASPLHRNAATIGGHLARGRLSDVVPTLMAIDAQVLFFDGEDRQMPLVDFYAENMKRNKLVVTGVRVGLDDGEAAFRKFARTSYDLATLNTAVAVRRDGETVTWARVVVGERPTLGMPLEGAAEVLVGEALSTETIGRASIAAHDTVDVRSDPRGSAEYRRHLTAVLVRRCLLEIAGAEVYA